MDPNVNSALCQQSHKKYSILTMVRMCIVQLSNLFFLYFSPIFFGEPYTHSSLLLNLYSITQVSSAAPSGFPVRTQYGLGCWSQQESNPGPLYKYKSDQSVPGVELPKLFDCFMKVNFWCVPVPFPHPSEIYVNHRRRFDLEDKAKVFASDWGTESLPR